MACASDHNGVKHGFSYKTQCSIMFYDLKSTPKIFLKPLIQPPRKIQQRSAKILVLNSPNIFEGRD